MASKPKSLGPTKKLILTEALKAAFEREIAVPGPEGEKNLIVAKDLLTTLMVEAATTGFITFPGQKAIPIPIKDWFDFVKWAHNYLEPAEQRIRMGNLDEDGIVVRAVGFDVNRV